MRIVYGGNRIATVPAQLAADFRDGDRLVVVHDTGDLLHIPLREWEIAASAVSDAHTAFQGMGGVTDEQVTLFFEVFAERLAHASTFAPIASANEADVAAAREKGRSTTRLILSPQMRTSMIGGLRAWARIESHRGAIRERLEHQGWHVDLVTAGLGVVGFVFEGRPNVFADATGVIRSGNTVAFRIGSDALGTARAIVDQALDPALERAGLPPGTVSLVDSPNRAAGWAMFSDPRLSLAVARGSGRAVSQLGAVARQAGIPVSLHGTGGAWLVAGSSADADNFERAVYHSLDRKVCNTLNTCCLVRNRSADLIPAFLSALSRAGDRLGTNPKLHVVEPTGIPGSWFGDKPITRPGGEVLEPGAEIIARDQIGLEWEWDGSPEVTLVLVDSVEEAVELFNEHSPQFVASLISDDKTEHERFFEMVNAPFVGNGFTRWVDGQYALDRPELGLSNWQFGRLFGRAGVLSGDSVYTVRTRATQTDPDLGR